MIKKNKKGIKHFYILLLVILILASLPLPIFYLYAKNQRPAYSESYYAALQLKYDRLAAINEQKIVVIGGSGTAFGIDTALMEKELGMPCVNFGLYAAIGLKPMMDLSKDYINKNDIIIISPETDAQMYSSYIGYDFLIKGMEGRSDIAFSLGFPYAKGFLSAFNEYSSDAKKLITSGTSSSAGVYSKSSFDQNGNMIFERPENIMDDKYLKDNIPQLSADIVTEDFVELINDYTAFAKSKGAFVYFGFCPINALSTTSISQAEIDTFIDRLDTSLNCPVIASLADHIMNEAYFYDSNYHVNDIGMKANTILLINDIKRVLGNITITERIPEPPVIENSSADVQNGSTDELLYSLSSAGINITGLTDAGKASEKLLIPSSIEGYRVVSIDTEAFYGCAATEIILPETITKLATALFTNAANLEKVYLNSASLPEVGDGLFSNANPNVKIYVPANLYGNYATDYFWGRYSDRIMQQ